MQLSITDYITLVGAMLLTVVLGNYCYCTRKDAQKTTNQYFFADKSMNPFVVAVTLASFMSLIIMLGVSTEIYNFGTQIVVIVLAFLAATPVICYGYLPVFFNQQSISIYEYLELRFGRSARVMGSIVYWIQSLMFCGLILYIPSVTLQIVTGLDPIATIIILTVICGVYACIGGMQAALLTDLIQTVFIVGSFITIITVAASKFDSFAEMWNVATNGSRIQFSSISADPSVRHTWWSSLIGGFFLILSVYGASQVHIQRLMTVKNLTSAKLALWMSCPILAIFIILSCLSGLAIYAYHETNEYTVTNSTLVDTLVPVFMMDVLHHIPGMGGLFVAGIFIASLSTITACINAMAATAVEDLIKPLHQKCGMLNIPEETYVYYGKMMALQVGFLCIAVSFGSQLFVGGGLLQASMTILGVFGGPLLGMFTLGMVTESANQRGAVAGLLAAVIFCLSISFKTPFVSTALPPPHNFLNNTTIHESEDQRFSFFRISYMWYSPLGFVLTLLIGIIVSLISGAPAHEVDLNLLFPVVARKVGAKRLRALDIAPAPTSSPERTKWNYPIMDTKV